MKSAIFYFLAYLIFAVCGVVISPFFFAFHLLDIGARSKELKYVISSVTQNGKSIILTVRGTSRTRHTAHTQHGKECID
jgi:hypothetical protein